MSPWWSSKWGKDNICPITHSRLRPGKNKDGVLNTIKLHCNHRFNRKAILEWLSLSYEKIDNGSFYIIVNNNKCPVCRACVNYSDLSKLISHT